MQNFKGLIHFCEGNTKLSEFLGRKPSHFKGFSPFEFHYSNFQQGNVKKLSKNENRWHNPLLG